jgi:fucose 4-O-acetylase-like acetyltransferase
MTKTRINWIDTARGMAFLMVIYSHQKYCNEGLMYFFRPVFLTTFFFISGYLFKSNFSFKHLLEHRIRTLLLPFFIFGFANILLSQLISFNEHISLKQDVLAFLFQRDGNAGLWFIAALFVMNFPFYFMVKYAKNVKALMLIALLCFIFSTIYTQYLHLPLLPWHLQTIGFGCFYMALGYAYKQYEAKVSVFLQNKGVLFLSSLFYLSILFVFQFFLHRSNISFTSSFYIVDALLITIIGISIILNLSKKMERVKLFSFVGANSLCYFAFHGKVYAVLQAIIEKIFIKFSVEHSILIDFFLGVGVTLLDALILIIPILLINKYLPFVLGKGFKFPFLAK